MWPSCDSRGSSASDGDKLFAFVTLGFTRLVCRLVSLSKDNKQEGGRSMELTF